MHTQKTASTVLSEFDISKISGLLSDVAMKRLKDEGYNELPSSKPKSAFTIALSVLKEPMFLLLIACGALYLCIGDLQEALMLLGFVIVVIGITFYQERKTERTLEALRDLSSPRALVIRDGKQIRIAGREVVREDMLVLAEGDRVPADCVLMSSQGLCADESLLTGESVPVRKIASPQSVAMGRPGGDNLPFLYSGTMIVQGQGMAQVQAVGTATEIGRIGKALSGLKPENTPLKREIDRFVRKLAVIGVSFCFITVSIYGFTRGNWLDGFLAGIAMAMAVLPEEFPVILTIFLALGAWRISKKQVLTRQVPAIEALGAATVLCVDKTGTLTQNHMSVQQLCTDGIIHKAVGTPDKMAPDNYHELLEFSILASQNEPFDPMEQAIKEFGGKYLACTEHLHADWLLVREYPLSQALLAMSHVWRSPSGSDYVIASKGTPEVIADLCHFDEQRQLELSSQVALMANDGLRVIGVARAFFCDNTPLPSKQHDFEFEFLGLLGLADPIRPDVPGAITECYQAGIRVVMITGDYPGTAQCIAGQIGLSNTNEVITGPELERMDDAELQRRISDINIFARVVPEQKLRIVEAFKANGDVVAMTGDGVNDAPALKSAHIGIAMGGRGTDVAREAADLVLLNDDFMSIVAAVRLGRRIFDNIKKAMVYTIAVHVPIVGMSLLPVVLGWPLVLLPVHIVFMELLIDPSCSIVFEVEQEESNVMCRPPRNPQEKLLDMHTIGISLMQGTIVLAIVIGVFAIAMYRGQGELDARALTFTTLIIANLGLIFTNRSWDKMIFNTIRVPNMALWWVTGGALTFLALVLYTPLLRRLFHFSTLHAVDIVICLLAGTVSILWFEGLKFLRTRTHTLS